MKKNLYLISIAVIISFSPRATLSQTAPNLNTAAGFVLFTQNGQFTSTAVSAIVVGDVGNEVGAVSAFPPGFVSGAKHFSDAAATQAGNDITAAYDSLVATTCDSVHGVGFGSGETLVPGVYCAGATSTLDGNLTLDAGGNSAAVFIIKINGQFSSSAGAQIILANGTTACNVFWQINGAVILNNTVFRGTMLVNGAITLNTGTILDGRALTETGSLIFGGILASVCNVATLPLQLVNFNVDKTTGNNIEVTWITASELNVLRYEVEASINGTAFYKVGAVSSKGNTFPTRYNFEDIHVNKAGVLFYRLKMIDKDGSSTYSPVKSIKFSDMKTGLVNIFPNPAGNLINITVNTEAAENVTLTITNLQGQKLMQKTRMIEKGINNIVEDVHSLSQGAYILSLKNKDTGAEARKNFQKL